MTLHFAPTEAARAALLREAVPDDTISVTGNTVIDALRIEVATQAGDAALRARIDEELSLLVGADWAQVPMVLITGHRRENFGDGIEQICQAIATLAERFPDHRFVYPVHLNPNVLEHVNRLLGNLPNVRLIAPQGYRNFVALMARCRLVLTDSGGVQEEAPSLGKPVLVMRDTTERPEGVAAGTAILTGPNAPSIVEHATRLLTDEAAYRSMATARNPYGDGHAAERIVERIRRYFASQDVREADVDHRAVKAYRCRSEAGARWLTAYQALNEHDACSGLCVGEADPQTYSGASFARTTDATFSGRRGCGGTIG